MKVDHIQIIMLHLITNELHHEKINISHMRKQRRRSGGV